MRDTEKTVEVIRRTTSYRRLFLADLVERLGVSRRDKVMFVTEDGQEFLVDIHGHLLVVEVTEEKMDNRPNFGPGAAGE